jgi:hypothetical protein
MNTGTILSITNIQALDGNGAVMSFCMVLEGEVTWLRINGWVANE